VTFLATVLWTGRGVDIERNVLIAFDLLLMVVLGLLLYSVSARDPRSAPGAFDVVQVVLVISALLADGVALWAIAGRITEFGFSPNRVAALGENVILLVNLAWSAVLYLRFLRRRGSFSSLEKWQTDYLPVYGAWAAMVAILFPPLFRYIWYAIPIHIKACKIFCDHTRWLDGGRNSFINGSIPRERRRHHRYCSARLADHNCFDRGCHSCGCPSKARAEAIDMRKESL